MICILIHSNNQLFRTRPIFLTLSANCGWLRLMKNSNSNSTVGVRSRKYGKEESAASVVFVMAHTRSSGSQQVGRKIIGKITNRVSRGSCEVKPRIWTLIVAITFWFFVNSLSLSCFEYGMHKMFFVQYYMKNIINKNQMAVQFVMLFNTDYKVVLS